MFHIDEQVYENCWNLNYSYSEMCVRCKCCSDDKKTRYAARVSVLERLLDERLNFDMWHDDPYIRQIQEANIQDDVMSIREELEGYKQNLLDLEEAHHDCD